MKRKRQGPQARDVRARQNVPPRNVQINNRRFSLRPHLPECTSHLPFLQTTHGTCWFVALLAVFFLSELTRSLVLESLPRMKSWKVPIAHHIADFFMGNTYPMTDVAFLSYLRSHKANVFNARQNGQLGGYSVVYLSRFLNLFEIPHAFFIRNDGYSIAEPSKWNLHLPFNEDVRKNHVESGRSRLAPFVSMEDPHVIVVFTAPSFSVFDKNRMAMRHKNLPQNVQNAARWPLKGLLPNRHTLNIKRNQQPIAWMHSY